MEPVSRQLVQHCLSIAFDRLPAEVVDRVKYLLLDHLGVALGGADSPSSRAVQRMLTAGRRDGGNTAVFGTPIRTTPDMAALANGVAAHALELDDVLNTASLHPGVTVMPAVLALAQDHAMEGPRAIEAIVAGYEVAGRVGFALDPAAHYARGYHPTATCGALAAAAASARLLGFSAETMLCALGIAGSQASGILEFLADGSYTKRFHPGWAAHSGVLAALLAREGFTGPSTVVEGRYGVLHTFSPSGDATRVMAGDWGAPYAVMRTGIKPHACCRYKHAAIDAILQIMRTRHLAPVDINQVAVNLTTAGFALVADPPERKAAPQTVVDAQFSMPFGAAMAILHGRAGLAQYTAENLAAPAVTDLMRRVRCVIDPGLDKDYPVKLAATVEIATTAGHTHRARVDYPKGDPENPLTWPELIDKFTDLARTRLDDARISVIVAATRNLEREGHLNCLLEQLSESGQEN